MTEKEIKAELHRAQELRDEANKVERAAIREALVQSQGMPSRAAALLGINKNSLLTMLRRQHSDLGHEARTMRKQAGYRGGNPNAYEWIPE